MIIGHVDLREDITSSEVQLVILVAALCLMPQVACEYIDGQRTIALCPQCYSARHNSELPQHANGRQQWQPVVVAVLENILAILIRADIVVETAHVSSIEHVHDFNKGR